MTRDTRDWLIAVWCIVTYIIIGVLTVKYIGPFEGPNKGADFIGGAFWPIVLPITFAFRHPIISLLSWFGGPMIAYGLYTWRAKRLAAASEVDKILREENLL